MKKIFASLLTLALGLTSVAAYGAGYKSVVITKDDNTTLAITMEDDLTSEVRDGEFVLQCSKGSLAWPVSEVKKFTFSAELGESFEEHLLAGVDTPVADAVVLVNNLDNVTMENLPADTQVMLVNVAGQVLHNAVVTGHHSVSLSGLSTGVYVLTYGNKSLKIAVAK
ncbi:MAG: T9SS type A sorting domain-containing protein [Paramuribaculum sp.]|nr:T9SS type A sorting domain-containing protein [Paramuribaculum sp.]